VHPLRVILAGLYCLMCRESPQGSDVPLARRLGSLEPKLSFRYPIVSLKMY
jgi:hypothetical protein